MAHLFRWNRTQRFSLILLIAFVAIWLFAHFVRSSPLLTLLNGFIFLLLLILLPFATMRTLVRKLTWRVRNRLFVTYFLVGILPIFLIFLFLQLAFFLVLGQMTNYVLHLELDRRLDQVYESAAKRAQYASKAIEPGPLESDDQLAEPPAWVKPGFKGIVKNASNQYFLAARADSSQRGHFDIFLLRPLTETFLSTLLPGMASIQVIDGETVHFRIGTREKNPNSKLVLDSSNVASPPASRGWWDSDISSGSPLDVRSLENGTVLTSAIVADSNTSTILSRVFSTLGRTAIVLELLMAAIAIAFLMVEIAAIVASVHLARTLTLTVHNLHRGTKKVESGDFSHRIPVKSTDQLSELASSFNGMTARIEQLIDEVKEKEKLESELEIARQVQAQLFPKEVPKLATLELAGVCNPARIVSGDYYDFIPIDSTGAAVVIGDISGKGISAALLMASVQASLHAQLAMAEGVGLSTASLVTRLNRQLYENTPPEKYATFYCAVYDDRNNRLSYTNAGHLAPILIRNGTTLRLESNGTVVGMFPEFPFEQATVELQSGDLLAAFTDGITESENEQEEQFGEDRLIDLLRLHSTKPLNEIIQTVMDAVGAWAHDPSTRDDITMLLARKL